MTLLQQQGICWDNIGCRYSVLLLTVWHWVPWMSRQRTVGTAICADLPIQHQLRPCLLKLVFRKLLWWCKHCRRKLLLVRRREPITVRFRRSVCLESSCFISFVFVLHLKASGSLRKLGKYQMHCGTKWVLQAEKPLRLWVLFRRTLHRMLCSNSSRSPKILRHKRRRLWSVTLKNGSPMSWSLQIPLIQQVPIRCRQMFGMRCQTIIWSNLQKSGTRVFRSLHHVLNWNHTQVMLRATSIYAKNSPSKRSKPTRGFLEWLRKLLWRRNFASGFHYYGCIKWMQKTCMETIMLWPTVFLGLNSPSLIFEFEHNQFGKSTFWCCVVESNIYVSLQALIFGQTTFGGAAWKQKWNMQKDR